MQKNPEDKARILAKFLGCKGQTDKDVYETLMKATPKELLINSLKAIHPDEKRRNLPLVFKPVIELESVIEQLLLINHYKYSFNDISAGCIFDKIPIRTTKE